MSVHNFSPTWTGTVPKTILANTSSHSLFPRWWPGMCLQACSARKVCRAGGTTAAESDDRAWLSWHVYTPPVQWCSRNQRGGASWPAALGLTRTFWVSWRSEERRSDNLQVVVQQKPDAWGSCRWQYDLHVHSHRCHQMSVPAETRINAIICLYLLMHKVSWTNNEQYFNLDYNLGN